MKKAAQPATPAVAIVIPPVKNFSTSAPSARPATALAKPAKRENTFSKSRDIREDRGTRQMKSSGNSRSFPHTRQS